ncbi:YcxB family protein [Kitasatospora sp. NPDC056731]|uniref:YcxB family protein n=1 Tax=Kitasatospora sp. NPDC056731 TaxID=3155422 RepID=UPI00343618C3
MEGAEGARAEGGKQVEESVEVRYTPTTADFRAAFAARARGTAAGRRARRSRYLIASCAASGAVLTSVADRTVGPPALVMLAVALLLVVGLPWLQLRQVRRMAADKGEFRIVLGEAGVTVTNAVSSTELAWRELPYYLETPELFVLLGGDEQTHVLTLLPKRGTGDPGRLGALIARHATVPARG